MVSFWIANSDPEKARVESVELVYEVISGYFEILKINVLIGINTFSKKKELLQ
jgi:hypothetical protein